MKSIYSTKDITDMLMPIFGSYYIRKAILFGSYGKGMASENSDIDLVVDSGLKGLHLVGFIEDIRRAVGKEVDVFDVTHIVKNSSIEREIDNSGVTTYEE
ncbi:MAG: nucleotidyltransferase domain-containing protein [Vallitaleaceae bacterium]|nr:nucleotidyltransferase domain-containing protein [Vallitaleaceae bacterium]